MFVHTCIIELNSVPISNRVASSLCLGLQPGSIPFVACAGLAGSVEPYQMQPVGAAALKAQGSSHVEG